MHRAVLQSPSVACQSLDEAAHAATVVASLLGVATSKEGLSSGPLVDAVRVVVRLAADAATRRQHGLGARNVFPLRPCTDGDLLQAPPLTALQAAWQAPGRQPIEVLVGANAEEMRFYLVPGAEMDRIGMDRVHKFAIAAGAGLQAVEAYAAAWPSATPGKLLCDLQTVFYCREPARRIAVLAATSSLRARHYEFAWRSPQQEGKLGAAHALELPFVFNTLGSPQGMAFAGPHSPAALAGQMHAAWAEFAMTGEVAGWPLFRPDTAMQWRLDEPCVVVKATPSPQALLWRHTDQAPPAAGGTKQSAKQLVWPGAQEPAILRNSSRET